MLLAALAACSAVQPEVPQVIQQELAKSQEAVNHELRALDLLVSDLPRFVVPAATPTQPVPTATLKASTPLPTKSVNASKPTQPTVPQVTAVPTKAELTAAHTATSELIADAKAMMGPLWDQLVKRLKDRAIDVESVLLATPVPTATPVITQPPPRATKNVTIGENGERMEEDSADQEKCKRNCTCNLVRLTARRAVVGEGRVGMEARQPFGSRARRRGR